MPTKLAFGRILSLHRIQMHRNCELINFKLHQHLRIHIYRIKFSQWFTLHRQYDHECWELGRAVRIFHMKWEQTAINKIKTKQNANATHERRTFSLTCTFNWLGKSSEQQERKYFRSKVRSVKIQSPTYFNVLRARNYTRYCVRVLDVYCVYTI